MPAVMGKPSLEDSSPKGKKGVSKEYGASGGDTGAGSSEEGNRWKKPGGKRSFLQRAKRFGKQGRHGKGAKVDAETYSYFVRILELLRTDDFDTDEDRETLVENSLAMAEGNEVQLSSNQLVSRVVESMLPLASEDRIHIFCEAFTPSLRVVVADPFASHVLEKLLEITSSDKWRTSKKLTDWFEKASMFVLNNFEDFTFDTYGSFVTKKVLECLSGHLDHPPKEQDILGTKGRTIQQFEDTRTRVDKWENMLQDFAKRFATWPQFNDLLQRVETSRLLQNVIQTVNRTQSSQEIVRELILRILGTLPETLEPDDHVHRTLEVALSVADLKMYEVMYKKYYKGNLVQYIQGPCFTLRKLICEAPNEKIFKAIFDELAPEIKKIVEEGRTVVIQSLASQCIKYNTKQEEFWKIVKDAYKTVKDDSGSEKANVLMKILTLKPNTERSDPDKFSTTYFGSTTLQNLIDFNAAVASDIWKCFSALKTPDLMKLALDPKASFIISKAFKSWNVPQDQKEKLLQKLQDSLVELAATKFGSRIIDVMWLWADVSQKTNIATILSQRIPLLTANKYGRFHVESMGLQSLARNKKEWIEHIVSQEKRKKSAGKIAAELGLNTEKSSVSPSIKEERTPGEKARKRKSEVEVPVVKTDPDDTETPKKKKKNKNRKSENALSDEVKLNLQEELTEKTETPKKSKKKHRQSECKEETEIKLEETNEGQLETPKKKKKKSENISIDDHIPVDGNETSKRKKHRKSEKGDDDVSTHTEFETHDATPKKKKKKNRESSQ